MSRPSSSVLAPKKNPIFADTLVTVEVGDKPVRFLLHAGFLRPQSEFFRNALSGQWEESETRIVKLPDDQPEAFNIYAHYVYTNKLPVASKDKSTLAGPQLEVKARQELTELLAVYPLGDKFMDTKFKDAVMREIHTICLNKWGEPIVPCHADIIDLYDNTPPKSPIRRLIVDMVTAMSTQAIDAYICQESWDELPTDFLKEVMATAIEKRHTAKARPRPVARYLENEAPAIINGPQNRTYTLQPVQPSSGARNMVRAADNPNTGATQGQAGDPIPTDDDGPDESDDSPDESDDSPDESDDDVEDCNSASDNVSVDSDADALEDVSDDSDSDDLPLA